MLSRRALLRLAQQRNFSSSALALKRGGLPSIGDVTHSPDSDAVFRQKVTSFRESLAAKARPSPPPSVDSALPGTTPGGAPATAADGSEKKGGIVKSILYGSEKGQREEAEMEQSYSKVLARGKYVHAIEFHQVKPDAVTDYVKLVGSVYPKIAGDQSMKCHLVGSWKTEIGDCDTFVHIWEYLGCTYPALSSAAGIWEE